MKTPWAIAATACTFAAAISAHAQSSVQLWGALDAGVAMVTNQKGGHNYTMDSGIATPNLWGLHGTEDLGGGNKAIFELIDQFNLCTGAIYPTNGGGLFGRSAYVGLSNDRNGKLTFGEQYDFMIDSLLRFDNSIYIAGLYGFREGPSKRTVLYTEAVYQKVSGDNNPQAWIMAVSSGSSNDKQLLPRVGILHRF